MTAPLRRGCLVDLGQDRGVEPADDPVHAGDEHDVDDLLDVV
jgi:hypothetical protein